MLRYCSVFVLVAGTALADPSGVVRVIDGDTFDVGGQAVRLFGIDAPEASQTCPDASGADWQCGAWVSREVRARYQGRIAQCDTQDVDRYGRFVATCQIDGADVGRELVQVGLAYAYRKYSQVYDLDEKGAAVNGRGIHSFELQDPSQFRAETRAVRLANTVGLDAPGICVIKGNISGNGNRIFHSPGQQHYARTGIRQGDGERWFCSEAEALAAGWRKAKR